MDAFLGARGALIRQKFERNKTFGETFISMGYKDPSHIISIQEIETIIEQKQLGGADGSSSWKKLPFVIGDDKVGYWFSKDKLDKYYNFITDYNKWIRIFLNVSSCLLIFGSLLLIIIKILK